MSAGLAILALVVFAGWMTWAYQVAPGPRTHATARILKVTYVDAYKRRPATAVIDIEFADGKRTSVSTLFERAFRCKPGDTLVVATVPRNVGTSGLEVESVACG